MPSSYPLNEPPDGELTDPEARRLIYEVARERFRVLSDAHVMAWWDAKRKHEARLSRADPSAPADPFPEYDPSDIQGVLRVYVAEARAEYLAIRELDLTF